MSRSSSLSGLGKSTPARQPPPLVSPEHSAVVPAPPPWSHRTGVDAVLERWLSERRVLECVAAERTLSARDGQTAPIPAGLDPRLLRGLERRGIAQLYSHQAEAITAALGGGHVVIATPTASGKSLCLHLPVLHALLREPGANALYLYPTKALSRDQ